MENYASRLKILGNNHAEKASLRLRIASICFGLVAFLSLYFGLLIDNLLMPYIGGLFFSVLLSVYSIVCCIGSVALYSNNALFRDRDEMLSAIRVLEAQRKVRDAMRDVP